MASGGRSERDGNAHCAAQSGRRRRWARHSGSGLPRCWAELALPLVLVAHLQQEAKVTAAEQSTASHCSATHSSAPANGSPTVARSPPCGQTARQSSMSASSGLSSGGTAAGALAGGRQTMAVSCGHLPGCGPAKGQMSTLWWRRGRRGRTGVLGSDDYTSSSNRHSIMQLGPGHRCMVPTNLSASPCKPGRAAEATCWCQHIRAGRAPD